MALRMVVSRSSISGEEQGVKWAMVLTICGQLVCRLRRENLRTLLTDPAVMMWM